MFGVIIHRELAKFRLGFAAAVVPRVFAYVFVGVRSHVFQDHTVLTVDDQYLPNVVSHISLPMPLVDAKLSDTRLILIKLL